MLPDHAAHLMRTVDSQVLELAPEYVLAYVCRGMYRALQSRLAEALDDTKRLGESTSWSPTAIRLHAAILRLIGDKPGAQKLMTKLGDGLEPLGFVEWYERMIEQRDIRAPWIAAHLLADRITSSRHWPALAMRMNLPESIR